MIQITDKSKCCGCTACYSVCPKKCITMKPDFEGFLYPEVNLESCVDCHACEKVCPVKSHKSFEKRESILFGVQYTDEEKRLSSTAGGAFSLLADYLIDSGAVVYIDTYVEPYEMKYEDISGDGHIPCFHADGDHWSFAKLDENGTVVEVREKVRISDNCTLGAYYFSSAKLYKDLYDEFYADDSRMEKNEKYIAPLYNFMIEKGMPVTISIVDAKKVHVLGTPEELQTFINQ